MHRKVKETKVNSQQKQKQKQQPTVKTGATVTKTRATKTRKPSPKQQESQYQITISDLTIDVVRKNIKNVHLGVYPPDGRVRIATPLRVSDEALRLFVISKLGWIKRQQAKFAAQERQSEREYVSGESHYFLGNRYLLTVIYQNQEGGEGGRPHVHLPNKTRINLIVRPGSDTAQRERVLTEWYRQQLKEVILPPLIEKWQAATGLHAASWQVKRMKTRWGSCNVRAKRIWLNLELAKKPVHCIEYVIVHELVHLLLPHHNDEFYAYMTKFLPKWQLYRKELNAAPLRDEIWKN
jgi:predicted metal-dependent hydrolase